MASTTAQDDQVRDERRVEILEAALALFAEKGLHHTKVSEIASRVGVSQGTIYWYFDSKQALFEAAFTSQFDALVEPIYTIAADETRSPAAKIADIAAATLGLFLEHTEVVFVMLQVMATQEVANILTHDFRDYYRGFRGLLAPLFVAIGDPDADATASLYLAVLDGLMLQALVDPETFDRERAVAQIREKFTRQAQAG